MIQVKFSSLVSHQAADHFAGIKNIWGMFSSLKYYLIRLNVFFFVTYIKLLRYYDLSQKFWYLLHLTLNSYDKYGRCRCISVQVTMQGGCACRFEYPGDSCSASLFLSFSLPVFCSTPLAIAYNFFNCLLSLERSLTLFQPSIQSHARSLCSFYSLMVFVFSEYFSPEIINSLYCSIFFNISIYKFSQTSVNRTLKTKSKKEVLHQLSGWFF